MSVESSGQWSGPVTAAVPWWGITFQVREMTFLQKVHPPVCVLLTALSPGITEWDTGRQAQGTSKLWVRAV